MLPQNNKNAQAAVGKGDYDLTQETPVVSSRTISSQRKVKSQLLKIPGGSESFARSPFRELDALKSALAIEKIDEGRKKLSDVLKLDGESRTVWWLGDHRMIDAVFFHGVGFALVEFFVGMGVALVILGCVCWWCVTLW